MSHEHDEMSTIFRKGDLSATAQVQIIKRKLSLMQMAGELGNVAEAAQIMGFHRDTFYDVHKAFQSGGVAALVDQRRGARGSHPNRVSEEVEAAVLAYCLKHPSYGAARVANDLRLEGVNVSSVEKFFFGLSLIMKVFSEILLKSRPCNAWTSDCSCASPASFAS